jgi:hypothetical protein
METIAGLNDCPDVSSEECETSKLIKRARKLRWIGMEKEAERKGQAAALDDESVRIRAVRVRVGACDAGDC